MTASQTILLLEDDPTIREAIEFALQRQGFTVMAFEDGEQAIRWLSHELPDLALLDMMVPGASGFAVAQAIKERSDQRVPVVMMSGNSSAAHRHYAFASGADTFLQKPFTSSALIEAIRRHCPHPAKGVAKQLAVS